MDEADPAADAGVGAQALLGLAAGNSVRLPSLAPLSESDPKPSTNEGKREEVLLSPFPAPMAR